ncbi:MAG: hypothetical protein H7Y22_09450 [Gemmatimonadaceae bacterium]|nr:hypothetical protein [Gloeobacterales cyanobacterium ES-bin-141]
MTGEVELACADLYLRDLVLGKPVEAGHFRQLAAALGEVATALHWSASLETQAHLQIDLLRRIYPELPDFGPPLDELWRLWLPLAVDIARQRVTGRPFFQGVLGPQGSGKTTAVTLLKYLLEQLGLKVVSLSLDDFYLSARERLQAGIAHRGPPGTHDCALGLATFKALHADTLPIWVPRFEKGAWKGTGDRFAWVELQPGLQLSGLVRGSDFVLTGCRVAGQVVALPVEMGSPLPMSWLVVDVVYPDGTPLAVICDLQGGCTLQGLGQSSLLAGPLPAGWSLYMATPDIVLFEGWFVGVRPVEPSGLTTDAARRSNKQLVDYLPLWDCLDRLMILRPEDPTMSKTWRRQAEQSLRTSGLGGMDDAAIDRFVESFWEALPQAVFYPPVLQDRCHLVVDVGADRRASAIFRPQ